MKHNPEDQFLLLSLYLDDEASPEERQQVEVWLKQDAQFRACYAQQVALRHKLRTLPTPPTPVAPEVFINQVLQTVERRSQRRKILGIGALCAGAFTIIGTVLSVANPERSPQFNSAVHTVVPTPEPLLIAMERPIVPLPKALNQP
jgi:hypothetical protein